MNAQDYLVRNVELFYSNLKTSFRVFNRHKIFTIINFLGFSIGLSAFLLISLWIFDELSFDKSYSKIDRLFITYQDQVYNNKTFSFFSTPTALANYLKEQFPEVERSTRFRIRTMTINAGKEPFKEKVTLVDPDFLDMFDVKLSQGSPGNKEFGKYSIIVSDKVAQKYFPNEKSVIGKVLILNNKWAVTILGVARKIKANSSLDFDLLMNFDFEAELGSNTNQWDFNSVRTYIELNKVTNLKDFSDKIVGLLAEKQKSEADLYIHPLADYHLHNPHYKGGSVIYVKIFGLVALLILLLACINFINLFTAISLKRIKEIGIRKTVGAGKKSIIFQLLTETGLVICISFSIAVILVELLIPKFNNFTGKNLELNFLNPSFLLFLLCLITITGILSGVYPGFYLSRFKPSSILQKHIEIGHKFLLRKFLVVFQFSISTCLIIGTLIILSQLNYIRNLDIGLNKKGILYFSVPGEVSQNWQALRNKITQINGVQSASFASSIPTQVYINSSDWTWNNKQNNSQILISTIAIDQFFQETFDISIKDGRFFSKDLASDSIQNILINETLANMIPGNNDIGKIITNTGTNKRYNIIGVIKDFYYNPIRNAIGPMIIFQWPYNSYLFIKANTNELSTLVSDLNSVNKQIYPDDPVDIKFLDETVKRQYYKEEQMGKLFKYFAFIAIVISSLGLYGLSIFSLERRKKEMGVRKVLGAHTIRLTRLLIGEFLLWIIISNIIAWPISYLIMNKWLHQFVYHIHISIFTFILTLLLSLVIAIITVLQSTWKIATVSPSKILRQDN